MCFDACTCEVLDFVENMNFPCQIFLLWKALDFVEGNSLPWRAEIDLVKSFLVPDVGALYRIRGPSAPPQIARGIVYIYMYIYIIQELWKHEMKLWFGLTIQSWDAYTQSNTENIEQSNNTEQQFRCWLLQHQMSDQRIGHREFSMAWRCCLQA